MSTVIALFLDRASLYLVAFNFREPDGGLSSFYRYFLRRAGHRLRGSPLLVGTALGRFFFRRFHKRRNILDTP